MSKQFSNTVKVEWLEDNPREMVLLEGITFTDSRNKTWITREGEVIDGASIPRFFWRVIGSPFVGHFRRSSVIHDVYCKNKNVPHKQVHKMFHEAMLADGVPKRKAATMYYAVKTFGPKW